MRQPSGRTRLKLLDLCHTDERIADPQGWGGTVLLAVPGVCSHWCRADGRGDAQPVVGFQVKVKRRSLFAAVFAFFCLPFKKPILHAETCGMSANMIMKVQPTALVSMKMKCSETGRVYRSVVTAKEYSEYMRILTELDRGYA